MSQRKETHLDDDQVLWAAVDEAELTPSLREHLSSCPHCRARKERLEENLTKLGQSAVRFAPSPRKKSTLSFQQLKSTYRWVWTWRTALATAMAAILITVTLWTSYRIISTRDSRLARLTQEMWEDEQLMAEIRQLEENALPPVYVDMSAESELLFGDEFIDFVVPTLENEIQSQDLIMGGRALC